MRLVLLLLINLVAFAQTVSMTPLVPEPLGSVERSGSLFTVHCDGQVTTVDSGEFPMMDNIVTIGRQKINGDGVLCILRDEPTIDPGNPRQTLVQCSRVRDGATEPVPCVDTSVP